MSDDMDFEIMTLHQILEYLSSYSSLDDTGAKEQPLVIDKKLCVRLRELMTDQMTQKDIQLNVSNNVELHELKQKINALNELNLEQSKQLKLLKIEYHSLSDDFRTMQSKRRMLNQEYVRVSCDREKLSFEMTEIKQLYDQKTSQLKSLEQQSSITKSNEMKQIKIEYETRLEFIEKKYSDKITKMNDRIINLQQQLLAKETQYTLFMETMTERKRESCCLRLLKWCRVCPRKEHRQKSPKQRYIQRIKQTEEDQNDEESIGDVWATKLKH